MSEEIKSSTIKETQDALSKYVKKPPLTEKLLKKPPFRYLHDIINTIIRETGFLNGLYSAEELDSNKMKDKESKIAFLDKLINAVKVATGENITVRPAKIVAGLEVHKTLELLQLLGKAIDEKIGTTKIVTEYSKDIDEKPQKSNKNDNKESKNKNKISKDQAKVVEKKLTNNIEKPNSNTEENKKSRSSISAKREILEKKQSTDSTKETEHKTRELKTTKNISAKSTVSSKESASVTKKVPQSKSVSGRRPSLKETGRSVNNSAKQIQSTIIKEENEQYISVKKDVNIEHDKNEVRKNNDKNSEKFSSNCDAVKANQNQNDIVNMKEDLMREAAKNQESAEKVSIASDEQQKPTKALDKRKDSIPFQRPGSARPGSRKLVHDDISFKNSSENAVQNNSSKKNLDEVKNRIPSSIRPRTGTRPPSARPGAPRIRDRGEVSVPDEVSTLATSVNVIEEGKQDQFSDDRDNFIIIESERTPAMRANETSSEINDAEQGQLVHQILKTQKELNESVIVDTTQNKYLEIEWEAGRQREKDIIAKEIDKIRSSIQTLTSAANPLGKLFDFLQEDVDEMQRELQHWKNVNEKLLKQQTAELELGRISLQPLQKQLSDIENGIQEEHLQIANIKTIILSNDERIFKLMTNTSTRTKVK